MQAAQRRIDVGVVERLLAEPYRFQFFQAVRVLELWFSRHAPGRTADDGTERIAFCNSLALTFPASELERAAAYGNGVGMLDEAPEVAVAVAEKTLSRVQLTPAFFGLLGGQGALPHHYTEQLAVREQMHRDYAAREFLDVFSNRATALFYAAWKKYRLPLQYELDHDERYLPLLLALAGVPDASTRSTLQEGEGAIIDEAIAGYALPVRHAPMSAAYLERTLSDYFRVPVHVEQFVGKWYDVPAERTTSIGLDNAVLGATALVGERVWQRDMCVRLVLGPLRKRDYEAFLPGGARAIALERMLTLVAGATLEYEISLVLARAEVGASQLGGGARLGWDAFLCTREAQSDRDDARYALHAIH